jgi:hypothetical protein
MKCRYLLMIPLVLLVGACSLQVQANPAVLLLSKQTASLYGSIRLQILQPVEPWNTSKKKQFIGDQND